MLITPSALHYCTKLNLQFTKILHVIYNHISIAIAVSREFDSIFLPIAGYEHVILGYLLMVVQEMIKHQGWDHIRPWGLCFKLNLILPMNELNLFYSFLSVTCGMSGVFSGYSDFIHKKSWPPRYNWNIVESGIKQHALTLFYSSKFIIRNFASKHLKLLGF
jgi:hypothetical protein